MALATFTYDNLGRRTSLSRGNGVATTYAYGPVSRLATLAQNLAGTSQDQSATFSYSPASQTRGMIEIRGTIIGASPIVFGEIRQ